MSDDSEIIHIPDLEGDQQSEPVAKEARESKVVNAGFEVAKWMIPILLSCVAIAISFLSFKEAYQNRVINEEINRPILEEPERFEINVKPEGQGLTVGVFA